MLAERYGENKSESDQYKCLKRSSVASVLDRIRNGDKMERFKGSNGKERNQNILKCFTHIE